MNQIDNIKCLCYKEYNVIPRSPHSPSDPFIPPQTLSLPLRPLHFTSNPLTPAHSPSDSGTFPKTLYLFLIPLTPMCNLPHYLNWALLDIKLVLWCFKSALMKHTQLNAKHKNHWLLLIQNSMLDNKNSKIILKKKFNSATTLFWDQPSVSNKSCCC